MNTHGAVSENLTAEKQSAGRGGDGGFFFGVGGRSRLVLRGIEVEGRSRLGIRTQGVFFFFFFHLFFVLRIFFYKYICIYIFGTG